MLWLVCWFATYMFNSGQKSNSRNAKGILLWRL
jgi:hypothetical protein